MNKVTKKTFLLIVPILFFVCFYCYVLLYIQPNEVYHNSVLNTKFPYFLIDSTFLAEHLIRPGGITEYLAAFLSQFYYYSWSGALVITLTAGLLCLAIRSLLCHSKLPGLWLISLLPAVAIIIISNSYYHFLGVFLAVMLAVWLFVLYRKISEANTIPPIALMVLYAPIVYYITSGASLIFICLCAIYHIISKKNVVTGIFFTFSGMAICYLIGTYIFAIADTAVFLQPIPLSREMSLRGNTVISTLQILFIYPVVTMLIVSVIRYIFKKDIRLGLGTSVFVNIVSLVILVSICAAGFYISYSPNKKIDCKMMYLVNNEKWTDIIALAKKIHPKNYNVFYVNCVNKALSKTGRLGEEMFLFPQTSECLFLSSEKVSEILMTVNMNNYADLGVLNIAQIRGLELMELQGYTPLLLWRLFEISAAKNQMQSACVFLNILSKDIFHGKKAKTILSQLQTDPYLKENSIIQHLRSVRIDSNLVVVEVDSELLYRELLKTNPQNRMAFDFMMADLLLKKRLKNFIENLPRLKDFSVDRIPRYYQQAILIYESSTGIRPDLLGFSIDTQNTQQGRVLVDIFKRFGPNESDAFKYLCRDFGQTYFFYYIFDISGPVE